MLSSIIDQSFVLVDNYSRNSLCFWYRLQNMQVRNSMAKDFVQELQSYLFSLIHAKLFWNKVSLTDLDFLYLFETLRDGVVWVLLNLFIQQLEQILLLLIVRLCLVAAQKESYWDHQTFLVIYSFQMINKLLTKLYRKKLSLGCNRSHIPQLVRVLEQKLYETVKCQLRQFSC